MKRLWAPWRVTYIRDPGHSGCIFCDKVKEDKDDENMILFRGRLNFVIMNAFPYNPGHLMVVPYRHLSNLEDLTPEERIEHSELISRSVSILKGDTGTESFNVGMNLGRAAGAGIVDHIHSHIVPRWNGDSNFMPVLAETRVISESSADIYRRLKPLF
jgi:ATP adenylyltransferase